MVGIFDLLKAGVVYSGANLGCISEEIFGDAPDCLKACESKAEEYNRDIVQIIEDPFLLVEGISQTMNDTYEEKGIAYMSGYVIGEVAQLIILRKIGGGSVTEVGEAAAKGVKGIEGAEEAAKGAEGASKAGEAGKDAAKGVKGIEEADETTKEISKGIEGSKRKQGTLVDMDINTKYNEWSNNLKDNWYTGGRSNKEIQSLGKDPAHEGTNRIVDIEKAMHEGEVGLDLEGRGKLSSIVRDATGKSEFVENGGNGQKWDIKSFNSNFKPKQGGFKLEKAMDTIQASLEEGEYVIVDTSNMSQEHIAVLIDELEKQGLMDKIIIWP